MPACSHPFYATALLFGTVVSGAALAETPADTLVIANTIDDIKSMDSAESFEFSGGDAINNIYRKLIGIDPKSLKPIPALAASWSASDDGRIFTFKLAEGRKFGPAIPLRRTMWSCRCSAS